MIILKNSFMKLFLVTLLITFSGTLFAEDILNANDLEANPSITSAMKIGKFTINATKKKYVRIDALDNAVNAEDGEIFNVRINLRGSGNAEYRSVKFKARKNAEIKVYIQSSGRSDARTMNLCDEKGNVIAELIGQPLPADKNSPVTASIATAKIPKFGEYYLTSAHSGMYIYQIIIK